MHDFEVMVICVKEYLIYVSRADEAIRVTESRIREVRERLDGLCLSLDRGGGGYCSDKMAEGVARIQALETEWAERVCAYQAEITECRDICSPMFPHRYAVYLHHVDGLTWGRIARMLGYAEDYVRKEIARRGVREIYYAMPEPWRRDPIPNAAPAQYPR